MNVRIKAGLWHAAASLIMALLIAILVFAVWYPSYFGALAGGLRLMVILVSVDMVIGPMLTLAVFNPLKSKRHLAMDLSVIATLQIVAMGYGLHALYVSRPVVLAAENQLFRVVAAADLKMDELPRLREDWRPAWWHPPRVLGVRLSRDSAEMLASIDWAFKGYDSGTRPSYWVPYEEVRTRVLQQAQPLASLTGGDSSKRHAVEVASREVGRPISELMAMEVVAHDAGWFVLLDRKTAEVVGVVRLGTKNAAGRHGSLR